MGNIKYLIWLSIVFGNSSKAVWKIIELYNSPVDAYYEIVSGKCKIRFTDGQNKRISEVSIEKVLEIISYCLENNINVICYSSSSYPKYFRELSCKPVVLYYKGNISCVNGKNITCVGTRNPCQYTVKAISTICNELVNNDFTIVSGFAKGADILSHLVAIDSQKPTVCILGCGIDVNYPSGHEKYKENVIKNGGVLISEYPPLERCRKGYFHKRNILLAALSKVTIVFEAKKESGSLITAKEAHNQGKKVLCIPPADIFDERYAGNINILRSIAEPLYGVEDIFKIYGGKYITNIINLPEECRETEKTLNQKNNKCSFTPVQQKILELLNNCTLHMDVIIHKLDMDIAELSMEIMELQQMGIIEEVAGNRFRKC